MIHDQQQRSGSRQADHQDAPEQKIAAEFEGAPHE
jgi:hypothetical protein